MASSVDCLIGLGSNLGPREAALGRALDTLAAHDGITNLRHSRWLSTVPVGGPPGQETFLNGAARFQTKLSASEVFDLLFQTEQAVGRERKERWGPRAIDLDLLLHGEQIIRPNTADGLFVPHLRMAFRRFVLEPAAEIAPQMRHPLIGWTVAQLLEHLRSWPPYFVISSPSRQRARLLALDVAQPTGATLLSREKIPLAPPSGESSPQAWRQQASAYFESCNQLLPAIETWPIDDLHIADFHPGEILWDAPRRISAAEIDEMAEILRRPKLCVIDGHPVPRHRGPLLDIEKMTRPQAVTEIVAAIEAMRE